MMSDHASSVLYGNAAYLRFLWWRGEYFRDFSKIPIARIKVRAHSSRYRFLVQVRDFLRDPRGSLRVIADFNPEIISSYPSILFEAAKLIESEPALRKPSPRFAATYGEMLAPPVRAAIEKAFGCEVYDRYGLEELGVIGLECAVHDGFHINVESVIVEILNAKGEPISHGEKGRVVVTDLFNYNMPFIRYDTGDQGYVSYKQCECGLATPRIWVTGRFSVFLEFGSRRIHHLDIDGAMDSFMNTVLKYQVAKTGDAEALVRVIPGGGYGPSTEKQIIENIAAVVGANVSVRVEKVADIQPTLSGKCEILTDETEDASKKRP
jgi:phenylacetate-CoA ligase